MNQSNIGSTSILSATILSYFPIPQYNITMASKMIQIGIVYASSLAG